MPPDPLTSSMLKPNFGKFCVTPLAILPLNVHVQSCTCKMEQLSSAQRTASTRGNDSQCFTTAMNGQRSHDPHMNESRTTCTSTGVWAHHKHVCKHTHTCAPMHSAHPQAYHKHVFKHTHTCAPMHSAHPQAYHKHVRKHTHTCAPMHSAHPQAYTSTCANVYTCAHLNVHVSSTVQVHGHKHVCKGTHTCTPTHTARVKINNYYKPNTPLILASTAPSSQPHPWQGRSAIPRRLDGQKNTTW